MFTTSNSLSWLEAVILGFIQGLTEFLPISSSAHLRIIGPLLPSGLDPGSAFTAITQLGTEMAVLVYFRQDIVRIFLAWCGSFKRNKPLTPDARLGWLVIVGTLPIAGFGLLFQHAIETHLRNLYLTAIMLIVFGFILGLAEKVGKRHTELHRITWAHGVIFGFSQALALIPGVSRSGGTITAGLFMGYTRDAAARYSFLLAVPAVFASGFYQLYKSWGVAGPVSSTNTILATLIAFVVGYAVIVWFLKIVSTRGYSLFVAYRLVLGVVLLGLLLVGVVSPT